MIAIEISSGVETVITPFVNYRFLWMGDHWKQEIVSRGGCQAIPRIWSVEHRPTYDDSENLGSPLYQRLKILEEQPGRAVAHLEGHSGPHAYSASYTFEERGEELVIDFDVTEKSHHSSQPITATYLIESSAGRLHCDLAATISWPHPESRLVFEVEPPAKVEANEAGMGTIRLKAVLVPDPSTDVHRFHYRMRWITSPGHQIWDRDV